MKKSRNVKAEEYAQKYGHIPIDYRERLEYLYDTLKIKDTEAYNILFQRDRMLAQLQYIDTVIILFEVPEGSPRPRFRIINRKNLSNMAISNPNFIHVYSLTGHEDYVYMKRLMNSGDFYALDQIICTPSNVDICAFCKTPGYYNRSDTILAEIGLKRPIYKPDWDNIEKKYSDMFNRNVWLDDTLVIDGSIHKFYSILPRIEIRLRFMNMLYDIHQYRSITSRSDYKEEYDVHYFK